jgi:hypothetical protein
MGGLGCLPAGTENCWCSESFESTGVYGRRGVRDASQVAQPVLFWVRGLDETESGRSAIDPAVLNSVLGARIRGFLGPNLS